MTAVWLHSRAVSSSILGLETDKTGRKYLLVSTGKFQVQL